ncbi:hypothetical protein EJB05_14297, partial [Eragrostis curvula]
MTWLNARWLLDERAKEEETQAVDGGGVRLLWVKNRSSIGVAAGLPPSLACITRSRMPPVEWPPTSSAKG